VKKISLIWILIFGQFAFCSGEGGGVGGFVGRRGGQILFQNHSMHVNPLLNDTLCLNTRDQYQAWVGPFYKRDEAGKIQRTDRFQAFQPRVSLREDCSQWRDPGGDRMRVCRDQDKIWVPFVQERYRSIPVFGERGIDFFQDVTIPRCR